jgi:hypothetical protein
MKILGGDFKPGEASITFGALSLICKDGTKHSYSSVTDLQPFTSASKSSIFAKAGWGLAGALALGPIGALAGVLGGGSGSIHTIFLTFSTGKSAVVSCSDRELQKLMKMRFG